MDPANVYANFVIDLSTPARKFNSRAMLRERGIKWMVPVTGPPLNSGRLFLRCKGHFLNKRQVYVVQTAIDGWWKSWLRYFCWSLLRRIDRCFRIGRQDSTRIPFTANTFEALEKLDNLTLEHFSSSPIPKPYRVIPFSKYKKYKREVERFLNGTSLDKRSRWQKQFSSKNEQPTYVTDTLDTDELIGSGGWELHANPCRWSVSSVPWRSQGCKWRDRVAEDQPVTQQFLSSSLATPFFESPLNDNNYFDLFAKWMKIESKKEEKNFEALHEKRSSNNDRAEACLNPYSNRVIPAVCLRLSSSSSRA